MEERATLEEVLELTKRLSRHDKLRLLVKLAPELEREAGTSIFGSGEDYEMEDHQGDAWRTFTYDEVN
jgi:hypothetical protein